jgi:hypothetical protein
VIEQIRHLLSRSPFETFSIELVSGRVIQIYDRHKVATTSAAVGVLHGDSAFEVINASQIASVSVGVHPVDQETIEKQIAFAKKWHESHQ